MINLSQRNAKVQVLLLLLLNLVPALLSIFLITKAVGMARMARERLMEAKHTVEIRDQRDIPIEMRDVCVRIRTGGDGGGSGVLIGPRSLLTNHHVIKGCATPHVWVDLPNGTSCVAMIKDSDEARDIALLNLPDDVPPQKHVRIETRPPEWGNNLIVVGCPGGALLVPSRALMYGSDLNGHHLLNVLSYYGSSGGPVLNARGDLVGLMVLMDPRTSRSDVPFLFKCVPAKWISDFIGSCKPSL